MSQSDENRQGAASVNHSMGSVVRRNQPVFMVGITLDRQDVNLLSRFCCEVRSHHLLLEGALESSQAQQLLQLLNRINNHIIPGKPVRQWS